MEGSLFQTLEEYWHIVAGFVAFVFGYAELRSKSNTNQKDIVELSDRVDKQRREDNDRHEAMLREIRADVKTLLQRNH